MQRVRLQTEYWSPYNLAPGRCNLGSLSWIIFHVAAAQVGSSSSSFLLGWGVAADALPVAKGFEGDPGSNPTKEKKSWGKHTFADIYCMKETYVSEK